MALNQSGKQNGYYTVKGCSVNPNQPSDLMNHEHALDDAHITSLFLKIDCNHNGRISVAEMFLFLTRQGFNVDHKKTFAILDKFDCNKEDDQLDLLEFIQFFRATFPDKCDHAN